MEIQDYNYNEEIYFDTINDVKKLFLNLILNYYVYIVILGASRKFF